MSLSWPARRVRPIQQMEAAECGVACLAMVLDHHGCSKPLRELREVCGTSRDGNSAKQLLEGARSEGLSARGVRLEPQALGQLKLPAILHWELNHFVVLEGTSKNGGLTLIDPATGRIRVDAETVDRCFSGIALEFEPTDSLEKIPRRSPAVRSYFAELKKSTGSVAFVLIAGACAQLLGVVTPAASQLLIDEVIRPARKDWLLPIVGVLLFTAAAEIGLRWMHQHALMTLQGRLGLELTRKLGHHLLRLPLNFVESRSRGDLLDRVEAQGGLGALVSRTVLGGFDLVFVAMLTALMLAYHPVLAALTLTIDAVRIFLVRVMREECRQRAAGQIAAQAREQAVVLEATSQRDMIRSFGLERSLTERYSKKLSDRLHWTVRSERLSNAAGRWLSVFDAVTRSLVLWWGGSAVIADEMTLGVFAGFLAIRGLMSAPLGAIVSTVESWLVFQSTLTRADDLFEERALSEGNQAPRGALTGRLELVGVGYRYGSGGAWVLRDVSFVIEPGQHTVLVGPSGQGKSTLLRIACGLLEPTEGLVLLDGTPIGQFSQEKLRQTIGAVVGTPLLLAGSARENLTLRLPNATEEELHQAIEDGCCDEVLANLRGGLEGKVEAQGRNFSGGERQRMGLVQALLGHPSLLVLDEATCFLDAPTEMKILRSITNRHSTIFSVAHRPAVIESADTIIEVQGGSIRVSTAPPPHRPRLRVVGGASAA